MSVPNTLDVINVSKIDKETGKRLVNAAARQGFLFITGTDISGNEADSIFDISKGLFNLPTDDKNNYTINADNLGYSGMQRETLDPQNQKHGDNKEAFNFGPIDKDHFKQPLPSYLRTGANTDTKEAELVAFTRKCYKVCHRVLQLLALGLDIPSEEGGIDYFVKRHQFEANNKNGSIMRMLKYPPLPETLRREPDEQILAGAHTDYGSITLLFQRQGQEGLEIFSPMSNKWESVPYIGAQDGDTLPPIVINIGDLLSYWTGFLLTSTKHRVTYRNKENPQDRYSIVFFSHPNNDCPLTPVPSPFTKHRLIGANDSHQDTINAGQHLDHRLQETYGWRPQAKEANVV